MRDEGCSLSFHYMYIPSPNQQKRIRPTYMYIPSPNQQKRIRPTYEVITPRAFARGKVIGRVVVVVAVVVVVSTKIAIFRDTGI